MMSVYRLLPCAGGLALACAVLAVPVGASADEDKVSEGVVTVGKDTQQSDDEAAAAECCKKDQEPGTTRVLHIEGKDGEQGYIFSLQDGAGGDGKSVVVRTEGDQKRRYVANTAVGTDGRLVVVPTEPAKQRTFELKSSDGKMIVIGTENVGDRPKDIKDNAKLYVALANAGEGGKKGRYWIGVPCQSVGPALRAQLGLPEGQGLLVNEKPYPDGPAAKADVKQYDILLTVDNKPLRSVEDLSNAVEEAKDEKQLALKVLRGGKERTLKVKPAKRPAPNIVVKASDADVIKQWTGYKWDPTKEGSLELHFVRPGVIVQERRAFDGKQMIVRKVETVVTKGKEKSLEERLKEVLRKLDELEKKVDALTAQK